MLEKLSNIASDIRNSRSGISYYNSRSSSLNHKLNIGDTLTRSQAAEFLHDLNWNIDELDFKNEKLFIRFTVEGISFETTFDLRQFTGELLFKIKAVKPRSADLFILDLKVFLSHKTPKEFLEGFPALRVLLRRIFLLDVHNELSIDDSKALDSLFDNIEGRLYEDLNGLSHLLLIFLKKYADLNFNFSKHLSDKQLKLFKIKAVRE